MTLGRMLDARFWFGFYTPPAMVALILVLLLGILVSLVGLIVEQRSTVVCEPESVGQVLEVRR